MKKVLLGDTNIEVSRLCFGSLTMTPFQANLSVKDGAYLIEYAFERGINFLDTAEIYENYHYIKEALKGIKREEYVIATKSYAYTKEMAKASLDLALKKIGTDYIDIFLLHEQESIYTVKGHFEAIEYFLKAKEMGLIRAFGISTHNIAGAEAARKIKEIEIIHPIVNKQGLGIQDGNIDGMLKELKQIHALGKGIYGMKPLGGGHLIKNIEESFNFVKKIPFIDSIAIGMQSTKEIDANISLIEKGYIPQSLKEQIDKKKRKLIVADYCIACENCVKRCKQNGINIIDKIAVPNEKCILCGYCATVCPEFCIKVI
ncbi:aldo/keto reductase [Tissierella creatinophila]|uniref:2,5-diketo-D-gluconic acid reductase A n=1 Tax=Tissierella creatinophila DSM 6911 TaxID=1123403 RepID=A0A1U7M9E4_TISCR|nr:aldo/keto reductase [Tissierella creatinophila]OLS03905.1 2,5-diketo-D-gluconic acid reductase A [Tissierella creatinophila DSM 6911]